MKASFIQLVTGAVPGVTLGVREVNDIKREAFRRLGVYWHENMRPDKFTKAGGREYGYQPRSGETGTPGASFFWRSYTGKKQKYLRHTKPLVASGESEQRSRMQDVRATATSKQTTVRVILNVPALNFTTPLGINMADEMRAISRQDEEELRGVLEADLMAGFDAAHAQQTKRF